MIDAFDFFRCGIVSPFALTDDVDGGCTGPSFMQVGFLTGEVHPVVFHRLVPCTGMVGHGVEQDTVHVEEDGFQMDVMVGMLFQIVLDSVCIHSVK